MPDTGFRLRPRYNHLVVASRGGICLQRGREAMGEKKQAKKDRAAQEAAARALQRQIDDIVAGRPPAGPPRSLRDFIDQKMGEDQRKAPAPPPSRRKRSKP